MRKITLLMHVSLDGYVAGPNGEMNWIKLDPAMFDFVNEITNESDTALYGRVTYEMMEAYWPTAADKPNATKHDREHSVWYNKVTKYVISRTLDVQKLHNTKVISDNLALNIKTLKQQEGKNILMLGSPSSSHSLTALGLIDEYWLFVNPILIGQGIPLFKHITNPHKLKLLESKIFSVGVIGLHYSMI